MGFLKVSHGKRCNFLQSECYTSYKIGRYWKKDAFSEKYKQPATQIWASGNYQTTSDSPQTSDLP